MKNLNKILCLLMVVVLAFGLAACGDEEVADKEENRVVGSSVPTKTNGEERPNEDEPAAREAAKEFANAMKTYQFEDAKQYLAEDFRNEVEKENTSVFKNIESAKKQESDIKEIAAAGHENHEKELKDVPAEGEQASYQFCWHKPTKAQLTELKTLDNENDALAESIDDAEKEELSDEEIIDGMKKYTWIKDLKDANGIEDFTEIREKAYKTKRDEIMGKVEHELVTITLKNFNDQPGEKGWKIVSVKQDKLEKK